MYQLYNNYGVGVRDMAHMARPTALEVVTELVLHANPEQFSVTVVDEDTWEITLVQRTKFGAATPFFFTIHRPTSA